MIKLISLINSSRSRRHYKSRFQFTNSFSKPVITPVGHFEASVFLNHGRHLRTSSRVMFDENSEIVSNHCSSNICNLWDWVFSIKRKIITFLFIDLISISSEKSCFISQVFITVLFQIIIHTRVGTNFNNGIMQLIKRFFCLSLRIPKLDF